MAKVTVDDDDSFLWPTERDSLLAEDILPLGAFAVLQHLSNRRLPHVEVSVALEVAWGNLELALAILRLISFRLAMAMVAQSCTMWVWTSFSGCSAVIFRLAVMCAFLAVADVACSLIQASMPFRSNSTRPK